MAIAVESPAQRLAILKQCLQAPDSPLHSLFPTCYYFSNIIPYTYTSEQEVSSCKQERVKSPFPAAFFFASSGALCDGILVRFAAQVMSIIKYSTVSLHAKMIELLIYAFAASDDYK